MESSKKIYITLSIFVLISLALFGFIILPLWSDIKSNSDTLVSNKNQVAMINAQINAAQDFNRNFAYYQPNLSKIDNLFIDPNNPVDFIKFLETNADASHISSKISLPVYTASQKNMTIQFSSSGPFSAVMGFTKAIESGPYLLEIDNLVIQNSNQSSNSKTTISDYSNRPVDANFSIKTFTK